MATRSPYEHKRLGNLIDPTQQWRDTEANCMSELLLYKYSQNPILADQLVNTGQKRLHEALADQKWATGSELASRATRKGTWSGGGSTGSTLRGSS